MSDITDVDIVDAMMLYGGSFVARLGELFCVADAQNQKKLKAAFPEYWKEYTEIVEMRRKQPLETK